MFSDDVNQGTINVVDGNAKSQDDYIFSHSCAVRVSITRYVEAIRWGVHWVGLLCKPVLEKNILTRYFCLFFYFFNAQKHIQNLKTSNKKIKWIIMEEKLKATNPEKCNLSQ